MWYSAVGSIVTVLLSLLAVPLAAAAQPPGKVYRIGYLGTNPPPAHQRDALLDGLRERGYIEGRNIVFERRFSEGKAERFPGIRGRDGPAQSRYHHGPNDAPSTYIAKKYSAIAVPRSDGSMTS